jgi:hypothetical protein
MAEQSSQASAVPTTRWDRAHMVALVVVLALLAGFAAAAFYGGIYIGDLVSIPVYFTNIGIWITLLALLLALTGILSHTFTGRWAGILIDERNKYSLSRLQMMMWTIIILSSFVAVVLANTQLYLVVSVSVGGQPAVMLSEPVGTTVLQALNDVGVVVEDIPPDANPSYAFGEAKAGLDFSGIKLTDTLQDGQQIYVPLVGEQPAPTLSSTTENNNADTAPRITPLSVNIPSEVWLLLGISTTSLVAAPLINGRKKEELQTNERAKDARFLDLFQGEEQGNFMHLDLAKLQLFYFTLIVVGAYMIGVASLLTKSQRYITSLPGMDAGVIALIGVSHAGYLSNKAVSHNAGDKTGDGDSGAAKDGSSQTSSGSSGGTGDSGAVQGTSGQLGDSSGSTGSG